MPKFDYLIQCPQQRILYAVNGFIIPDDVFPMMILQCCDTATQNSRRKYGMVK